MGMSDIHKLTVTCTGATEDVRVRGIFYFIIVNNIIGLLNVQLMCFNWYTSLHNLNAYQIFN